MRVAIDITPLQTGHKDRGVGAYTRLLIEALQKYENGHSYHFFVRGQKVPDTVELIHYPYFDPYFVTLPFIYQKPTVVTVHDLIPLVFPGNFPVGPRGMITWQYQKLRLTKARRIIADSQCSKNDIHRLTGRAGSEIDVIPLAPAPFYKRVTDTRRLEIIKKKYRLPDAFVLYVGDVNWNKNVIGMIAAFREVKNSLVLVGKAFMDQSLPETRHIHAFIKQNGLDDRVVRTGSISADDLVGVYNLASVYLQPSLYEGFGLPVLEAMASGVPVVSSGAGSLSEIAGPATLIDPNRSEDIARGIHETLALTSSNREKLMEAQRRWVQRFSWESAARQTIACYEKALV